ncbi:hypothetical protein BDQ94DRAFT_144732 [Aspergillus welwitschiae]|uniref:Uncharacterized protein n=1 Tax=Aspergillus welwitschiae TaxID=1341132 RepID=A0A3F3Q0D9_9EURO|nr:hypothetical protein BDQ94DRAFT_144732 [Aspergillus welwitschiae]RDH32628.1 hypothetical protein BDQ94DRAFT_144732 [Aspergillus welwitschiae]
MRHGVHNNSGGAEFNLTQFTLTIQQFSARMQSLNCLDPGCPCWLISSLGFSGYNLLMTYLFCMTVLVLIPAASDTKVSYIHRILIASDLITHVSTTISIASPKLAGKTEELYNNLHQ